MSASITQAARWSRCTRQVHYVWLDESEVYKAAFEKAERVAARTLEDEAIRRAHQGVKKAIRYKGKIVGYEHEYSDTLMGLLLKGALPRKYKDHAPTQPLIPGDGTNNPTVIIQMIMQELADAPPEIRNRLGQRLLALNAQADAD